MQDELEVELTKFIRTIKQHLNKFYYLDVINDLIDYYDEFRGNFLPIGDLFEKHKKGLLKQLLNSIKEEYEFIGPRIPNIISALHEFDVEWPELDVIEKSIKSDLESDHNIQENQYNISNYQKRFNIDQAIAWFNQGPDNFQKGLGYLLMYDVKVDEWPHLKEYFDNKKDIFIKYLLNEINNDDLDIISNIYYVLTIVHDFIRIGLRWKELYIIDKSLHHESNKLSTSHDDDEELDENNNIVWPKRFNSDANARLFNDMINNIKEYCASDEENWTLVKTIYENLAILGKCSTPLFPYRADMLHRYKDIILKCMLTAIKTNQFEDWMDLEDGVLAMIAGLRKFGVNWPELNIIEKSARAKLIDENNILEDFDNNNDKFVEKTIQSINNRELWGVGWYIRSNGFTSKDFPQILHAFNVNKEKTIKFLLYMIKTECTIPNQINRQLETIDTFINFGLNWPELEIMRKSLNQLNY